MVLAELAGGIAQWLEHFSNGRVFFLQADGRAGHADFGQARTDRILAGDKARASCGAALLGVVVGEGYPFLRHAVDVGGLVAHHAAAEMADVPYADVVPPENQDIRFLFLPSHLFLLSFLISFSLSSSRRGYQLSLAKWNKRPIGLWSNIVPFLIAA